MNYLNGVDSIAQVRAIAYQLDLPESINIDTAHDVIGQLCVYLRKSNLENITQAIEALYKWGVSHWSLIDHIANSTVMKRQGYTRISG
jgi:flagellin-specific chaperone FliS